MSKRMAQAHQQAALQVERASAVKRPVGRPCIDPASKSPPPPKRPVQAACRIVTELLVKTGPKTATFANSKLFGGARDHQT